MVTPDFTTFEKLTGQGNLIPIYREIPGDLETPVALLRKLGDSPIHFLLESLEGGEKWGRYSFLGADPERVFTVRGEEIQIQENGSVRRLPHHGDPLGCLKDHLGRYRPVSVPGLPRFYGGAVGFCGYELAGYFERLPPPKAGGAWKEEAVFLITDTLIIFDHLRQTIQVVACTATEGRTDLRAFYAEQVRKINLLVDRIQFPWKENSPRLPTLPSALQAQMTPEDFQGLVRQAQEYIVSGDIIQVVLSQRFLGPTAQDPWTLYRALRRINPSPYLFYIKMEDLILIGSSPEVLVRQEGRTAELRPIAGTRQRGAGAAEDRKLAAKGLDS